jgi:signal transduction histidine kinase
MNTGHIADHHSYGLFRELRRLAGRPHWSAVTIRTETFRALPVVAVVAIVGAAGFVVAVAALAITPPAWTVFVGAGALMVAATAAEAFPLPIEDVNVPTSNHSLAFVFIVATAAIYDWREAAVVGFLSMVLVELWRRKLLSRIVFNTGLYVSAAIAAGAAASTVSGTGLGAVIGAATLASLAFYLVDMLLLSAVVGRARATAFPGALRRYVAMTFLPFLVMASLAVTLVVLWDRSPFASLLIVGPLIMVALYERSLHRAFQRLREFDRLKDEFIAVISHELRTPLTSVYGAALTLQRREVDEDMRGPLLAIVSDEAGRLARLLDSALSASRLHAHTERFEISPTDGVRMIWAVADAVRPRLPTNLELVLTTPSDVPPVAADPDKLRQVLVNLTENAIKYSPDGGTIEMGVESEDSVVRFAVRDEGIGIPLDAQPHIFERFHRVDPNMTRGVGGTGLGLYICRELVEHMGGRIWVTSREGEGSTFQFELPVADLAS